MEATPSTRLDRGDDARDGPIVLRRAAMAWVLLLAAGLLEIVWAFTMKLSQGFTRPNASIVTVFAMLASFGLDENAPEDGGNTADMRWKLWTQT